MTKLKSIKELRQKANEVDVNILIDAIEEVILKEEERGCGKWENQVCVLPNYPELRPILFNIKPIIKGKYWLVYDRDEMTRKEENFGKDEYILVNYIRFLEERVQTLTKKGCGEIENNIHVSTEGR